MSGEPITRPEYENGLEGLRRELQAMGQHIGGDLSEIRAQLSRLLDVHHQEGREVGEMKVRLDVAEKSLNNLHEARRQERMQERNNRFTLYIGISLALLGHLLTYFRGAK